MKKERWRRWQVGEAERDGRRRPKMPEEER